MIRTIESAQNGLRTWRSPFAFEVELLENFEARLDLCEIALRIGHLLLHTLAIGGDFEWTPWVVLTPGQTIQCQVSAAAGISCLVSGSIYTI